METQKSLLLSSAEVIKYVYVMLDNAMRTLANCSNWMIGHNNKTMGQWNGSLKEDVPGWYHKRLSICHGMCQKAYQISIYDGILPILKLAGSVTLVLTLKAPITTAADNKFCDIFPSFRQK